jgi:hypothetical protein
MCALQFPRHTAATRMGRAEDTYEWRRHDSRMERGIIGLGRLQPVPMAQIAMARRIHGTFTFFI